ncbi:MAG: preprotein translocase subunit SecE [Candidatus Pacebacteria bacterium]|nr:preprotein translocase subunit SecE [Candidatus Paceibacterota bacterium]
MFEKLVNYLKGTKAELGYVNWPTKKQTVNFTLLVIGVSLLVAAFLGFFDTIFTFLLEKFVF